LAPHQCCLPFPRGSPLRHAPTTCRTSLQKHSRRPQTSPQIETLLVAVLLYHPLIENTETPQTSAAPSSVSTNSRIASMVHTWRYLWESSAWGPETRCGQLSIATVWIGQYWLIDNCEPSDLPKITCETGISYEFVLFRDQPTKEDNWKNSYNSCKSCRNRGNHWKLLQSGNASQEPATDSSRNACHGGHGEGTTNGSSLPVSKHLVIFWNKTVCLHVFKP
jgi:hypothetical protein